MSAPPNSLDAEFVVDDFKRTYLRDSIVAIQALQNINAFTTDYQVSVDWLSRIIDLPTEQLAQKISIVYRNGLDYNADLSSLLHHNLDGGLGGLKGYPSNNLDTAFALQGLTVIHATDAVTINGAVNYLLSSQNTDGGWGFVGGEESRVYYTAIVMQALETQGQTTAIANALSKAATYLLFQQQSDGSWGNVSDTALAAMALVRTTSDATARASAAQYVSAQQLADGSWNDDPYSTALAVAVARTLSACPVHGRLI